MESTRLFQSPARSTSLDGLQDVITDGALIQGLRRIADLAKIGVLGAIFSIVLLYVLGEPGVTVVNVGLTWVGVKVFGVDSTGMAFFGSYVFHGLMVYPMVRRLSEFRWSVANWQAGLLFLSSIAVVFGGFYVLPPLWAYGIGTLVMILSGVYSIRTLLHLVSLDRIPQPMQRLLGRFRFV